MSATHHTGRDRPWLMRTYSGHSSAEASNRLYRSNVAKGQTGLSIAFDLPTQTGYDADHPLARGEVGKVGVPISHVGDMMTLFDGLPLDTMNTSMTINATASWLLALYIAVADKQGVSREKLSGTTQNDIIKEYLSRGTYVFPPKESLQLTTDMIVYTSQHMPKWNPINICSYHLQEAGATPVQELAFALANACGVLDMVREKVDKDVWPRVVGRISFFVNAGTRFITELCKMRAFAELWDELTEHRYGVQEARYRRFRYGVQVNSLGLTEQQPENNVYRILLSMLAVVLSKQVRARAIQLPAWNEALGLPRPWDQQWSLRLQQIVAFESDILDYGDIFEGAPVIEEKVRRLKDEARQAIDKISAMGGLIDAVQSGYLKAQLVDSHTRRQRMIEEGRQHVVGVNCYQEGLASPLLESRDGGIFTADPDAEQKQRDKLVAWRQQRDEKKVQQALHALKTCAQQRGNIMESSIACAHAGVTTGEWGACMRDVYGEYRAPTGIGGEAHRPMASTTQGEEDTPSQPWHVLRQQVQQSCEPLGRRPKILIGKPGLDGHSNGAEQIAMRARDAGFEVVYEGIRLTPEQIVQTAVEEGVHMIGLSVLSGSHNHLVRDVLRHMKEAGIAHIPLVVGGIIPPKDSAQLKKQGVSAVYTPKNFNVTDIMQDILRIVLASATHERHGDAVSRH
ncbi:MAG: protein meaA [Alphaproteobacteria bacterium GM7ARS4]|nr:protein meaA [Alphaproteobacteria bacterium GM7ARS4]